MAFVVEDGTGLSNANSYASVAFADSYFSDRGITTWSGTNADKETWLIRATDYIDLRFGRKFAGCPLTETQALAFPRDAFDGMPTNLLKATAEYALRAMSAALAPDPERDASGRVVTEVYKKVGPIETRNRFAAEGPIAIPSPFKPYPAADYLLVGLFKSNIGKVIRN